jgi:N6-L-threonylcarbamoyladenine synthase
MTEEANRRNIKLHIPPLRLCTDNAVMGAIAVERIRAGRVECLALNISPGLVRGEATKT